MKQSAFPRRSGRAERGVAIVIVILFLGLLLLLGLGAIMTATSELRVSANTKLALEAFNVADAGAVHAKKLVTNLQGDFSDVLQGPDGTIRTGDEFTNAGWPALAGTAPTYTNGVPIRDGSYNVITYAASCYDATKVAAIAPVQTADTTAFKRALVRLDSRHLYELIAYDDARDTKSYLFSNSIEQQLEDAAGTSAAQRTSRDFNRRVLIRSIGYVTATDIPAFASGAGGLTTTFNPLVDPVATATVDIVVGFNPFPAIVTNNDLTIGGNAVISGSLGAVHTNDDLIFTGRSYSIDQSATWSDTDGSGGDPTTSNARGYTGQADRIILPDLNPMTYAPKSDVLFVDSTCSDAQKIALYQALGIWAPQGGSTSTTSQTNYNSNVVFSAGVDLTGQLVFEYRASGSKYLAYNLGGSPPTGWTNQDTTNHGGATSSYGFKRNGSGTWTDTGSGKVQSNETYFFLLPTNSSGSKVLLNGTGTTANPTVLTVLSTTSIDLNGNFVMKPKLKGLTLENQPQWALVDMSVLAGMDIRINGGASTNTIAEEGLLYAHEQIDASGNGEVKGQIIAYDQSLVNTSLRDTSGSLVSANDVSGNFVLNHEIGTGYLGLFGISAWRELREFRAANAR